MNTIPLTSITVSPSRQRREFNPARMHELTDSIESQGLFNAIVLRQEGDTYVLVSGERRLRAVGNIFDLGGTLRHDNEEVPAGHIPYTLITTLSSLERELAELDENIKRDDLTWQERAAALARIATLRQQQAVEAGEPPPTATELAQDLIEPVRDGFVGTEASGRNALREQLTVARFLDDPEVASAKTVGDAYKLLRRKESRRRDIALAAQVGTVFTAAMHTLLNTDALLWLAEAPAAAFDVILTDPPYGINADEFADSGGKAVSEHQYKDDKDYFIAISTALAGESYRITKEQAHLYWFCDIDNFAFLKGMLDAAGWWVHRTPLVWHKPSANKIPWPQHGPRRTWELILYAVKGKRPTLKPSAPDVLAFNSDENLGHSAQKPVALFAELLGRSARAGDTVLDPFCGTGPIFPAAHGLKIAATGIELDQGAYGIAAKRLGVLE
jgi:DNA modification methylase